MADSKNPWGAKGGADKPRPGDAPPKRGDGPNEKSGGRARDDAAHGGGGRSPWGDKPKPAADKPKAPRTGERGEGGKGRSPWGDRPKKSREPDARPEGRGGDKPKGPRRDRDDAGPRRSQRPGGERRPGGGDRRDRGPKRPPLTPRALAAIVLRRVFEGQSLSDALPWALELCDPQDRGLMQELCYGVLRHGHRLEAVAARLMTHPLKTNQGDVQALILIGLYQIIHTRVPAHAAVSETVTAASRMGKPWAGGLVNGVLRNFQREREWIEDAIAADPFVSRAFPAWLGEAVREAWPEHWERILEAANERPPMVLRVNRSRIARGDYFNRLLAAGIPARPLKSVPSAILLDKPQDVTLLPGFDDGQVSVQDGGAQLAAPLLAPENGMRVLDACAAPGGKTGHLLEIAPECALTALDQDETRLQRVRDNLGRLGQSARVVLGDAAHPSGDWAAGEYQRILLDAPCSASGVIRRHPDIKWLRRAEDISALARTQAAMLDALWPLLAAGGRLLYATCSLLPAENQEPVSAFLERTSDAVALPLAVDWGLPAGHGRQILPLEPGMDGFFYALLEKRPEAP